MPRLKSADGQRHLFTEQITRHHSRRLIIEATTIVVTDRDSLDGQRLLPIDGRNVVVRRRLTDRELDAWRTAWKL